MEVSGNSYAGCDGKYFLTSQLHGGKPIYAKYGNSRQLAIYGNKWACYGSSIGGGYFVGSKCENKNVCDCRYTNHLCTIFDIFLKVMMVMDMMIMILKMENLQNIPGKLDGKMM